MKNEHSSSPMVWVHLGLTVVTAGLWLPVWLFLWLREAAFMAMGAAFGAVLMWTYRLVERPVKRLARALYGMAASRHADRDHRGPEAQAEHDDAGPYRHQEGALGG